MPPTTTSKSDKQVSIRVQILDGWLYYAIYHGRAALSDEHISLAFMSEQDARLAAESHRQVVESTFDSKDTPWKET